MTNQAINGKGFEYACLQSLFNSLSQTQDVIIEETASVNIARGFYHELPRAEAERMKLAAQAAIRVILRFEPQLEHPQSNIPLYLGIQGDAQGTAGDVRDILCFRKQNQWEIGFSCKHNHFAIKHSRLSNTIDFGTLWLGKACSPNYFDEIRPLFSELSTKKSKGFFGVI